MDAKKVYRKLLIFLLPIAIAWGMLEHKLAAIPNSYNLKRALLEKQADSITVLALGTSHIYHGVDPSVFSVRGFNLANVNQSLYYDKRITLKYLGKMPRLNTVIIEVGYYSLYYQVKNHGVESWRDYFYSQFWGINYKDLPLWDMKRYSEIALYTPEKVKEYAKRSFHENLAAGMTRYGYMPEDTLTGGKHTVFTDADATVRMALWNSLTDSTQCAYIRNDLEDFVSTLRQKGIQVVFINTPVLPLLSGRCRADILATNKKIITSLCEKYHCRYFDYFTDPRFTPDEFADVDHLNSKGAAHFSNIINDEILLAVLKK